MREFLLEQIGQWEYLVRLVIAALCGALIGLERSHRQKEAGVRTHLIVCFSAALMVIVSKYGFFDVISIEGVSIDASRVAANVITGISFLGAGVIFVKSSSVKGLTTSAGLWATSAVGLAIGAGLYLVAVVSTVMLAFLQAFLHKHMRWETQSATEIHLTVEDKPDTFNNIKTYLDEHDIEVDDFSVRKKDGLLEYEAIVRHLSSKKTEELIDILKEMPGLKEFFCSQ